MLNNKEIAVIGMGPSGISASIYLKRFGFTAVCYEKDLIGGKTNYTDKIVNYPGYTLEKGQLLANEFEKQIKKFNIEVNYKAINKIIKFDDHFKLVANNFEKEFDYVILAIGLSMKKNNILGIDKFFGKGISSCAICDGNFYKNKKVVVYGNGNECLEETLYLSSIANKTILICPDDEIKGVEMVVDRVKNMDNIEIFTKTMVIEATGRKNLESIRCKNKEKEFNIDTNGLFLYGQMLACSSILDFEIDVDKNGFVCTDSKMETSVKNLFAIGDYRNTTLRQVATAVSDGAICANSIYNRYFNK